MPPPPLLTSMFVASESLDDAAITTLSYFMDDNLSVTPATPPQDHDMLDVADASCKVPTRPPAPMGRRSFMSVLLALSFVTVKTQSEHCDLRLLKAGRASRGTFKNNRTSKYIANFLDGQMPRYHCMYCISSGVLELVKLKHQSNRPSQGRRTRMALMLRSSLSNDQFQTCTLLVQTSALKGYGSSNQGVLLYGLFSRVSALCGSFAAWVRFPSALSSRVTLSDPALRRSTDSELTESVVFGGLYNAYTVWTLLALDVRAFGAYGSLVHAVWSQMTRTTTNLNLVVEGARVGMGRSAEWGTRYGSSLKLVLKSNSESHACGSANRAASAVGSSFEFLLLFYLMLTSNPSGIAQQHHRFLSNKFEQFRWRADYHPQSRFDVQARAPF
ncbi:hypothetical protein R3P38DRAFT_2795427 [Favolaschia claudopus]|uniref:Uncharacterized protein n=1 Tax=Favolaschia claudopus TaxID=2862362 RepID=A0AAW0A7R7_9AGAR